MTYGAQNAKCTIRTTENRHRNKCKLPTHSVPDCHSGAQRHIPAEAANKVSIFSLLKRGCSCLHLATSAHHSTYPINSFNRGPGISFVNKSAIFVAPSSHATRMIPAACASRARWYAIALCRFFNTDSGAVEFLTTDWLSQNTAVDPIRGIGSACDHINSRFHSTKLRTERRRLNRILPLRIPKYGCLIHEHKYTCM